MNALLKWVFGLSSGAWLWAVGLLVAAGVTAYGVQTWRLHSLQAQHAGALAAHANTLKIISDLATAAAEKSALVQQTWATAIAAADTRISKEKDDALRENESLRRGVVDGSRRLRIQATCPSSPASGGDVPQATAAASVDAQGTAELDAATGQLVHDLRAQLIEGRAALIGLQEYVRAIQGP